MPRETVRKGFRIAARASILAPHSSEIGLFRPFRGLLRLQFGARGDFSDSLRRVILGNSRHKREGRGPPEDPAPLSYSQRALPIEHSEERGLRANASWTRGAKAARFGQRELASDGSVREFLI